MCTRTLSWALIVVGFLWIAGMSVLAVNFTRAHYALELQSLPNTAMISREQARIALFDLSEHWHISQLQFLIPSSLMLVGALLLGQHRDRPLK
jgi:hypothetical protein